MIKNSSEKKSSYKNGLFLEISKEEMDKLKEKWEKIRDAGEKIESFSGITFLTTLLSPFDFEGPIAEILSAVLWLIGKLTTKIAANRLKKLNCASTTTGNIYPINKTKHKTI